MDFFSTMPVFDEIFFSASLGNPNFSYQGLVNSNKLVGFVLPFFRKLFFASAIFPTFPNFQIIVSFHFSKYCIFETPTEALDFSLVVIIGINSVSLTLE